MKEKFKVALGYALIVLLWMVVGTVGLVVVVPLLLLFIILFMVYSIVTYPFKLIRGFLRPAR